MSLEMEITSTSEGTPNSNKSTLLVRNFKSTVPIGRFWLCLRHNETWLRSPSPNLDAPLDYISQLQTETALLFWFYRSFKKPIVYNLAQMVDDSMSIKHSHENMIDWASTTIHEVITVGRSTNGFPSLFDTVICTASRVREPSGAFETDSNMLPLHVWTRREQGLLLPRHSLPSFLYLNLDAFLYCRNAEVALRAFSSKHGIHGGLLNLEKGLPRGNHLQVGGGTSACTTTTTAAASAADAAADTARLIAASPYDSPLVLPNRSLASILPPPYLACQCGLWMHFEGYPLPVEDIQDHFDLLGVTGYTDIRAHYARDVDDPGHMRPPFIDVQFGNMAATMEAYDRLRADSCWEVMLRQQAVVVNPLVVFWPRVPLSAAVKYILPAMNIHAGSSAGGEPYVIAAPWPRSSPPKIATKTSSWSNSNYAMEKIGDGDDDDDDDDDTCCESKGVEIIFRSFEALRRCRGKEYKYYEVSLDKYGRGRRHRHLVRVMGGVIFDDVVHCTLKLWDAGVEEHEVVETMQKTCPEVRPRNFSVLKDGGQQGDDTWQVYIDPMSALNINSKGGIRFDTGRKAELSLTFWKNTYEWFKAMEGAGEGDDTREGTVSNRSSDVEWDFSAANYGLPVAVKPVVISLDRRKTSRNNYIVVRVPEEDQRVKMAMAEKQKEDGHGVALLDEEGRSQTNGQKPKLQCVDVNNPHPCASMAQSESTTVETEKTVCGLPSSQEISPEILDKVASSRQEGGEEGRAKMADRVFAAGRGSDLSGQLVRRAGSAIAAERHRYPQSSRSEAEKEELLSLMRKWPALFDRELQMADRTGYGSSGREP